MKQIRESKFSKIVAYYLMIMMFLQVTQPMQMYALTSGPTQPEFNSFTPIGTSDMVDLASGDFNYNIPVMDVGGYPLNLSYNSGITMDQEASWVGLGWNMNVGQIERQVRGLPDDFRGDLMTYENNTRDNVTVGMNLGANAAAFGWDGVSLGVGLGVETNNYEGISFKPSFGIGFQLSDNVSVGLNLSSSVAEGASVSPSVSISAKSKQQADGSTTSLKSSLSLGLSSRKGIENLNLSASVSRTNRDYNTLKVGDQSFVVGRTAGSTSQSLGGIGGSISFNNQSYSPSKRIAYENSSFTFNAAVGGEVFGIEGQVQLTGYGSYQKIRPDYKFRVEKAFGYENTDYKRNQSGVLDFNRENERVITEKTTSLPLTNYTYDIYSIEGQGVSGMFRPFRSQVGNVYNDNVVDNGKSNSFGVEIGLGQLVHGSGDFRTTPSTSRTGPWISNNAVRKYFTENITDARSLDYEPYTYKLVGSMVVDPEQSIYENQILGSKAVRFGITGWNKNGSTLSKFERNNVPSIPITDKIKRKERYLRNQVVQKVTNEEAIVDHFVQNRTESFVKPHHTAGIKVLQTDGTTYVFGKTAYNTSKVEATFDVSGRPILDSNKTGLIGYNGITSNNNNSVSDMYLNKITTPAYAHSYMISNILSSDYEDVDDNGPSMKDLGSFTQFDYEITESNYKWRIPFESDKVTYNNGLNSKNEDQKGTYIYGEKELVYLKKIVTKTHVAFFDLEYRKDAIGVAGQRGGKGNGRMKYIKSIRLYARPEVTVGGMITDPGASGTIKPIKTAHFEYNYSQCQKIPNNINTANGLTVDTGKLTLKKVYFTYRGSNMGKYTPYIFNYSDNNPDYDSTSFDIWGNYKKNIVGANGNVMDAFPTNLESPFVTQNATTANANTGAWTLKQVDLPSGGKITIETESDDYQFVQSKKAMQMFNVIGAGGANPSTADLTKNELYNGNSHKEYIYVKLSNAQLTSLNSEQDFKNQYLDENYDKAIQFRFMLNMRGDNNWQYENVKGYFEIDKSKTINIIKDATNGTVAVLPVKMLKRDGGTNGKAPVNPIAKAGWGFGRSFLNRIVYGLDDNPTERDFESIVRGLEGSLRSMSEIFKGPNKALQDKGCAKKFNPGKSWVRLENPNGRKYGGGLRVKSVKLSDQWSNMLSSGGTDMTNMEYGQTYSYNDENQKSSGVATYEPNASSENPLVEPFYNNNGNYAENIAAPMESNYVEKPFGENFFPSPRVTYSRVSVKNIEQKDDTRIVKKHATGEVVTGHFTSYDFPTKVDYTNINVIPDITPNNIIRNLVLNGNVSVRNHLTMSQGYSIETNDMNGKVRYQKVYAEGKSGVDVLSSVEYLYNIDENGNLDNNLTTIDAKGAVNKRLIGLDYDMINDFNESFSTTESSGVDANLAAFIIPVAVVPVPVFIPTLFPKSSYHENQLRTAVTTKHIHKTGILIEKIAKDLESRVSTKNLAWDASSGEVILTETINEFNDHYYSFTYPAYWMYDGMGLASQNIGIEGFLKADTPSNSPNPSSAAATNPYFKIENYTGDITKIFHLGDELYTPGLDIAPDTTISYPSHPIHVIVNKLWVVGYNSDKTGVLLMDKDGNYVNQCADLDRFYFKIARSGYRNLQSASMASVTSMINPLKNNDADPEPDVLDQNSFIFDSSSTSNPRIVNASAVVYNDFWNSQMEADLPYYPDYNPQLSPNTIQEDGNVKYPYNVKVNPYVWNIKGDWRAQKSYAYLTGRNASSGLINNPRNEGFFNGFSPFYQLTPSKTWEIKENKWTPASSVTKYSPYGAELENEDALHRHSAAQYGYQYKLPMAVASNTKYSQIGYEGFEERSMPTSTHHFGFDIAPTDITTKTSHTGKSSLKVKKGQSALLSRNLFTVDRFAAPVTCPTPSPDPVLPGSCRLTYTFTFNSCVYAHEQSLGKRLVIDFGNNISISSISAPFNVIGDINIVNQSYVNSHAVGLCINYNGSIQLPANDSFKLTFTMSNGQQYCVLISEATYGGMYASGSYKLRAECCND